MKTTRRRRCGSVSKLCPDPTLSDLLVIGAIPPHLPRYASAIEHARPISSHAADENIRYHTPASRSRKQRDRRLRYGEGAHRRECVSLHTMRSVSPLTPATASVTQLYAFYYVPNPPYAATNGWSLFSPREEFGRMGVGSRTKAWRFTDINKDYSVRRSFPSHLTYSYITDSNPALPHLSRPFCRSHAYQRHDIAIRGEVS